MQLDVVLGHLKGSNFISIQQYRENGFTSAITTACSYSRDELDVPPIFKTKWTARKKRVFDYNHMQKLTLMQ